MKRLFKSLTFCILLTITGQVTWAQDLDTGRAAYEDGDFEEALREWRPLAEQGNAFAQFFLGMMYVEGTGVPQDFAEAHKWFRLAAEQGIPEAQQKMGAMYAAGTGVPQDYAEAVKWNRLSAEQGDAGAQFVLGLLYADGKGVIQDNVHAHMWLNIAASLGYEDAAKNRNIVAARMSAEDISKAQQLARECVAKDFKDC